VLLAVNLDNGDETADPPLGNGATDFLAGLAVTIQQKTEESA